MVNFPEQLLNNRGPYHLDLETDYASLPYSVLESSLLEGLSSPSNNALDGYTSITSYSGASGWSHVEVNATGIKGTNYIPDASQEYIHNFQLFLTPPTGTFTSGNIAVELDKLETMGISHLRVFQNMYGFALNRDDHISNLTTFANMCSDRSLQIILVMFDGIGAEYSKIDNFWYAPWYHLFSPSGQSGIWDPTSRTNPGLIDNTGAPLARFTGDTYSQFSSKTKLPGVGWGDWLSAPGQWWIQTSSQVPNQIRLASEYPEYPTDSNYSGFWQLMKDYIDETLNVFTGSLSGTLHSVDLLNEGELSTEIYLLNNDLYNSSLPSYVPTPILNEYSVNMPLVQSYAYDRLANFCAYWTRHIHTEHVGIPVTIGHFELIQGIELLLKANAFGADCLPDYYSIHTYGDGWNHEGLIQELTGSIQTQLSGFTPVGLINPITEYRDFVINEFWRTDSNTDDSLKWTIHFLNKHGVGGTFWGAFQTQAFNVEVDTNDWLWFAGYEPSYEAYPALGIMGHYPAGTLLERNPTLIDYVSGWCHSGYAPIPSQYYVSGELYINNYSGIGTTTLSVRDYSLGTQLSVVPPEKAAWFFTRVDVDPNFYWQNYTGGTFNPNLSAKSDLFKPYPNLGPANKRLRDTVSLSKESGNYTDILDDQTAKALILFDYPGGNRRTDGDYFINFYVSNSGIYNPDDYYNQYFTYAHMHVMRMQPPSSFNSNFDGEQSNANTTIGGETQDLIDAGFDEVGVPTTANSSANGIVGGITPNYSGYTGIITIDSLKGCNYVPSPAYTGFSNPAKMFLSTTGYGSYETVAVSGDLQALKDLGVQTIRVFHNPWGYIYNREEHISNLTDFASLCKNLEMKMSLVLFEGVGYDIGSISPYHGWHSIVSDTPTNYWDVNGNNEHLSNPLLVSGALGFLDVFVSSQESNLLNNFRGGYWLSFPGAGYLTTFDHVTGGYGGLASPGYPDSTFVTGGGAGRIARHSGMWQMMLDYTRDVCNVFTGEYRDALHSIDIGNETETAANPDIIYSIASNFALIEYISQFPYNPALSAEQAFLASTLGSDRQTKFLAYWNDLIHNEYGYPTTVGSLGYGEALVVAYKMFAEHLSPLDFISAHDYGAGYGWNALAKSARTVVDVLFGTEMPLCINECWRQNNGGDKALLHNLWYAQENNIGVINWSLLEDNAFGADLELAIGYPNGYTGTYYPFTGPTGYKKYPDTGIVRRLHNYSGVEHTGAEVLTHVRRPDLTGFLYQYYQGNRITEPLYYTVEGPTFVEPGKSYNYTIVDQHRRPMRKGSENIHWRVAYIGDYTNSGFDPRFGGGLKANSVYGFGWSVGSADSPAPREAFYNWPSAGSILVTSSGNVYTHDSTVFEFEVPYSTTTRDILIGGMISWNGNLNLDDFDNLQLETVFPKRIRVKKSYPFLWKHSYYFNENPNEWVGGPVGERLLKTSDLKTTDNYENSYSQERYYYRKFFMTYVGSDTLSGAKVFLEDVDYTGHIKIAVEQNAGDAAENINTLPQNITQDDFQFVTGYSEGLSFGDITPGNSVGVWVQFNFNDPYSTPGSLIDSSFKLSIEGF